jgi:hypothetical protein
MSVARRGLFRTVGRTAVIAGTAQVAAGRVARRQRQRHGEAFDSGAHDPNEDESVAQLRQLAELRDQGILTEDEFTAKKAQILGI